MRGPAMRIALYVVAVVLLGYLVVLALRPTATPPGFMSWFGKAASWRTIAIVTVVLGLVCVLSYRARRNRASATVPVAIVIALTLTSFVLAFSSYWSCNNDKHPTFFTPLAWTALLLKGGVEDRALGDNTCPARPPVALDVARIAILAAIFLSVVGVLTAVFRSQSDRLRVGLARSVTAVVGLDDDAQSMVSAIAQTLDRKSALVLMTASPDRTCIQESRTQGARVIPVDFNRPETVGTPRLWRRLDRLYLLSPDPSTSLLRLELIGKRLAQVRTTRRIPLIVRIDDPWLAEAWRAEQFGRSDTRWAADAVGKYEVTARRLVDQIIETNKVRRLIVCGSSRLTLAVCADMARRQTEREYHTVEGQPELPALTLVAENASEYKHDHEFHQERRGFGASRPPIDVVAETPTVKLLSRLISDAERGNPGSNAVVFVDVGPAERSATDPTIGTRLAAHYPAIPIYTWDTDARVTGDRIPIVGQLRSYRLAMDLPDGQAHDNWERAAMLIHERFTSKTERNTPPTLPWAQLDEFYRESNRRQVRNALWMVEQIAGHTWNTWGSPADRLSLTRLGDLPAMEQLKRLGFAEDAAKAMARQEFEDWSRYYREAGWRYGDPRNYDRKLHEKLVDWSETESDPVKRDAALESLAATLVSLRQLGYRSLPTWERYRRTGSVTAKRRWSPWTWTSESQHTMSAGWRDWEVSDGNGEPWSVRNDIFRATYRHVDGDRWESSGTVLARPAKAGETIETLEGRAAAADGDWVVQGDQGEQWPVPKEKFAQRYRGPVPFPETAADPEK
jgi:hypothetical protein